MATAETVWYRHKKQDTLHEVIVGSDQHKQIAKALTEPDPTSNEVPEPVYDKVNLAEVRKLDPTKVPGYVDPKAIEARRAKAAGAPIVVQAQAGPSEDEIQARIDAAVQAAVAAAVAALAPAEPAAPQTPADSKPAAPTNTAKGK